MVVMHAACRPPVLPERVAGQARLRLALPATQRRRDGRVCFKRTDNGGPDNYQAPATIYTALDPEHGGICPYSQAALIALLEKRRAFREIRVDLANKPSDFVDLYHSIVTDKAAREHVPLLVDGQTRLVESGVIAEYLARQYADEGAPLLPPDPSSQARVALFIRFFADTLVPPFKQLLHAQGPEAEAAARRRLLDALAALDDFLALHGGYQGDRALLGPHYSWRMHEEEEGGGGEGAPGGEPGGAPRPLPHYFMGAYYSLAEVCCTPWVARMVEVLPEWRGLDVLAACQEARLHRVTGWIQACLERPSAAATCPSKDQLVDGMSAREWSHAT